MEKVFLVLLGKSLPRERVFACLEPCGILSKEIEFVDDYYFRFSAEEQNMKPVENALAALGISGGFALVLAQKAGSFAEKLLRSAFRTLPSRGCYPSEVVLREISFGDFSSFAPLVKMLRGMEEVELVTAKAYLHAGLDAKKAAAILGVHRNTFNYRLDQFIAHFGLDIRDYHNAMLLELYFGLADA